MSSLSSLGVLGVLAVLAGSTVVLVCFVPYVAWSYRRYGVVQPGRAVLLMAAALYAVGLWTYTILPLPADPQQWCAAHTTVPQLRPLQLVRDIARLGPAGLSNPALLQVLLNLALFVPLGALVRALSRWSLLRTLSVGLAVSLLVELTQLSGNWGLYPCAYRLFDVDDLLVNTTGAGLGVLAAPVLTRLARRPAERSPRSAAPVTTGRRLLGMLADVVSVHLLGAVLWAALVLLSLATGSGRTDGLPSWQQAMATEAVPALVLLLLVPRLNDGATVGQLATGLRPVRPDGSPPLDRQVLLRFTSGSGVYFLLLAGDDVVSGSALGSLARLLAVVSVLLAWRSSGHRGLSGFAAGVTVLDARSAPAAARTVQEGSGWELRRMSTAVLTLAGTAYLSLLLLGVIADASTAAGTVAVLVVVVAFAGLTVGLTLYLLVNGLIMLRRERRSLGNGLSLLAGLGAGALLTGSLLALTYGSGWVVVAAVSALAVSGYLGFLLTAFIAYGLLYGRLPPTPGFDTIVALGSGLLGSRVPPLLASRLDRAAEVFDAERALGNQPQVICSGGRGAGESVAEATAMAAYLRRRGVPAEVVVEEDRSRSTEQNLQYSWAMAQARGGRRMVAVTNDFHAFRAALLARELGVPAQVVGSSTARYYFPSAVLREFVGVLSRRPVAYGSCSVLLAASAGALARLALP